MKSRASRLTATVAALATLCVVVIASYSFIEIQKFLSEYEQDGVDAYNAAGQFFNMTLGLPLALMGALLGIAATLVGQRIADRQGDVQILQFVESKVSPSFHHNQGLASTLEQLLACGLEGNALANEIMRILLQNADDRQTANTIGALVQLGPDGDPRNAKILAGISDESHRELAKSTLDFTRRLTSHAGEIFESFEGISTDLYASLFCRSELAQPGIEKPLRRLQTAVPMMAKAFPSLFSDTIPELASNLKSLSLATRPVEILQALREIPDDYSALEFLGLVLYSRCLTPEHLVPRGNRWICRYRINFGAAYLLAIYQVLPGKAAYASAFEAVFAKRASVALKFIETAVPHKTQIGKPVVHRVMTAELALANRLITVDIKHDPLSDDYVSEFYDPAVHGEIPDTAYMELPPPNATMRV